MIHDFATSLAKSNAQADAPWWPKVYRIAFPDMVKAAYMPPGSAEQLRGIDRIVTLRSGKEISIDEKVRDKVWPDIAIERWSDLAGKKAGWAQKSLYCDFLAYAFVPSQECHLLPFQTIRRAWRINGREWCDLAERRQNGFSIIRADNRDPATGREWTTESIGVPIPILYAAIRDAMVISWKVPASPEPPKPIPPPEIIRDRQWSHTIRLEAWRIFVQPGFPADFDRAVAEARAQIFGGKSEAP